VKEQNDLSLKVFRGLFSCGSDEDCPIDRFPYCDNLRFTKFGVEMRDGSTQVTNKADNIMRGAIYKPTTGVSHDILLVKNGANYDLIDYNTAAVLLTQTLPDFALVNLYGRAYVVFHCCAPDTSSSPLYVYDGTTFRLAAGVAPVSALTVGATAAGNLEAGNYYISYALETASGYITPPYATPAHIVGLAAASNKALTIPVGPAGTAARWVVATKAIPANLDTGGATAQEFFFLPNGRIGDNVTTAFTMSYFSAELLNSADYLFDIIPSPVSGGLIAVYQQSRLILGGGSAAPNNLYVSKPTDPETFINPDGIIIVDPGESGGITSAAEHETSLIVWKLNRTYVTADNDDIPSTWALDTLDNSVGTTMFGVAMISDRTSVLHGSLLVGTRAGLLLFNGQYSQLPLTWNIRNWWSEQIDLNIFKSIQLCLDTEHKRIYTLVPVGTKGSLTLPNTILMGDYSDGLDPEAIKWCPWTINTGVYGIKRSIQSIWINTDSFNSLRLFALTLTDYIRFNPGARNDEAGYPICPVATLPYLATDESGDSHTFSALRLKIVGAGNLFISFNPLDTVFPTFDFARQLALAVAPGKSYDVLCNFISEKCSITLHLNTNNPGVNSNWFKLTRFHLYCRKTAQGTPSKTGILT
jgi:hypothetical protein